MSDGTGMFNFLHRYLYVLPESIVIPKRANKHKISPEVPIVLNTIISNRFIE